MNDYLSTPRIRERLDAERKTLLEQVERIPADLRDQKPAPDRWSVAEVLEHLVRIESGVTKLLGMLAQSTPPAGSAEPGASAVLTPHISSLIRDRSQRIEAPDRVKPGGAVTAAEALTQLEPARTRLLAAFDSADAAALDTMTYPHPVFGPLTLRSWVAFSADHEARHAEQIGEIGQQLAGTA